MRESPVAHVDLAVLDDNYRIVREHVAPGVATMAMVKADGYGHGLEAVAKRLAAAGSEWFGVASPGEALALRAAGVRANVLLLSPIMDPGLVTRLCDLDVALVATDEASVERYQAADLPKPLRLHVKVDTGMGRLGLPPAAAAGVAEAVARAPGLELEALWTHFSDSDGPERGTTVRQIECFIEALDAAAARGLRVPLRHACNSAGILAYPEAHFDVVRPGILLYGYAPSAEFAAAEPRVRPSMRLSAPVTFVKRVPAGTSVSYGQLWTAAADATLATVRIGYADGYPRMLTGKAWASLNGARCPIVGRVCMDQLIVDASAAAGVAPGDRVTLWGGDGPSADELASQLGTVAYEFITRVMPRVEREYLG